MHGEPIWESKPPLGLEVKAAALAVPRAVNSDLTLTEFIPYDQQHRARAERLLGQVAGDFGGEYPKEGQ